MRTCRFWVLRGSVSGYCRENGALAPESRNVEDRAVERRSDKHAPRVDDEMGQETGSLVRGAPLESRAQEPREQEGPADREPVPDALVTSGRRGTTESLSPEEASRRAEFARHLPPSAFPGAPGELTAAARAGGAPDDVVDGLRSLPPGSYASAGEVWAALHGRRERRAPG